MSEKRQVSRHRNNNNAFRKALLVAGASGTPSAIPGANAAFKVQTLAN
jgi:hypothetical protein